jgi:hypothetical protein
VGKIFFLVLGEISHPLVFRPRWAGPVPTRKVARILGLPPGKFQTAIFAFLLLTVGSWNFAQIVAFRRPHGHNLQPFCLAHQEIQICLSPVISSPEDRSARLISPPRYYPLSA